MVDLREDRARVAQLWENSPTPRVPLSVAAAFAFHYTQRGDEELLSDAEYACALDIAAAALACLVPLYVLDGQGEPVPVRVDFAKQRFCGGGAGVRSADGSILAPLAVQCSDVLPVLPTIERSGIEYLWPRRWQA